MNDELRRRRMSPGWMIVLGIIATLVVGVVGAFGWLAWVWSQTPERVRAGVGNGKRAAVITIACMSVATFLLGLVMTVVGLRHAFDAVSGGSVDPSQKARLLAEGISTAMNWTAAGMIPLPIAVIVCFVAGYRLLRATQEVEPS